MCICVFKREREIHTPKLILDQLMNSTTLKPELNIVQRGREKAIYCICQRRQTVTNPSISAQMTCSVWTTASHIKVYSRGKITGQEEPKDIAVSSERKHPA